MVLQSYHHRRRRTSSNILPHSIFPTGTSSHSNTFPRHYLITSTALSLDIHPRGDSPGLHSAPHLRILLLSRLRFPRQLDLPPLLQDCLPGPRHLATIQPPR